MKLLLTFVLTVAIAFSAGDLAAENAPSSTPAAAAPHGDWIRINGSSTVFPISEAVADQFQLLNDDVRVTVAISGTGGGFESLLSGQCDIADASRPITAAEAAAAARAGIDYVEVPIARDGLSVAVHPANDWVDYLTIDELRRIWAPERSVTRWSDVRPAWPSREIHLYGPGPASGTFDYFTGVLEGERGRSRLDYTAHEDDNVLAQGIAADEDALGYFGYGYYVQHRNRIRLVPIDEGAGPVSPSVESIEAGAYRTLSRLLFLYVRTAALERPPVAAFVDFYLAHARLFVAGVGAVPLPGPAYALARERLARRCTGSLFGTAESHAKNVIGVLTEGQCAPHRRLGPESLSPATVGEDAVKPSRRGAGVSETRSREGPR
jgi:phosphate transport system substrate-binding protein